MGADGSEFDSSESNSGRFEYEGALREVVGDEESDDAEDEDNEEDEEEGASEEEDEEVVFDGQGTGSEEQLDGALFDSDEAFARALQDKDDRDTLARLMAQAGIHDFEGEYETDSNDSQDMWQDVDPDNMSYEELIALGEAVGTESRGLSTEAIAALPRFNYALDSKDDSTSAEQCVVCRIEYEDGDPMLSLPCKHQYHSECIEQWLHINKVCPVCSAEVCPSGSSNSENKR
jgi:E3 ubiquitin-protein ligase BIG BROTHER-like protein